MKGTYTLSILERIGDATVSASDVFAVIIDHPNCATRLESPSQKLSATKSMREEHVKRTRRYYNLMAWLKRDGLVRESTIDKKKFFDLTEKGKRRRKRLTAMCSNELPPPSYPKEKSNQLIIVAFDIPEREKRKREWFRKTLKNLGFRMIQKSVWHARTRIPAELLQDLRRLRMMSFVEIFGVTKHGSLRILAKEGKP